MKITLRGLALAATAAALATGSAQAAVTAQFTGGNGTPLSLTLADPIVFTVGPGVSEFVNQVVFVFDGASLGGTIGSTITGDITYSINGGPSIPLMTMINGINMNSFTADDIFIPAAPGNPVQLEAGDTITLSAGTITTTGNVTINPSTATSFNFFVTHATGTPIGGSIPEPSAMALLGLGAAGFFLRRRRAA